jgi:hypothetical protein
MHKHNKSHRQSQKGKRLLTKKHSRTFSAINKVAKPIGRLSFAAATVIGIVVGIVAWVEDHYKGSIVPEQPEISAQNTSNISVDVLPFIIIDKNLIFKIHNVRLHCFIDLLYFMDADRKTGLLRDSMFSEGATAIDSGTNYECDTKFVHLQPDGALEIGFHGGQSLVTRPSAFRPPMTILKMCVEIDGEYESFDGTHSLKPVMFQWPAKPNINQWIKGPIAFDYDPSIWIPEHSSLGGAWATRALMAANGIDLAPNALRCDWEDKSVHK